MTNIYREYRAKNKTDSFLSLLDLTWCMCMSPSACVKHSSHFLYIFRNQQLYCIISYKCIFLTRLDLVSLRPPAYCWNWISRAKWKGRQNSLGAWTMPRWLSLELQIAFFSIVSEFGIPKDSSTFYNSLF